MIKQDDIYYLFCTGRGISVWSSKDMRNWEREDPGFGEAPGWTDTVVPGLKNHIWAPDITYRNGTYYLYYSVSAFGKNTSAIGVATNSTLDSDDPGLESTSARFSNYQIGNNFNIFYGSVIIFNNVDQLLRRLLPYFISRLADGG